MNDSVITQLPIPEDENEFIAWMDWHGPDVLKLLHDGLVDCINWGVTDTERFEKAKRRSHGRVLCVTGKHPTDHAVSLSMTTTENPKSLNK